MNSHPFNVPGPAAWTNLPRRPLRRHIWPLATLTSVIFGTLAGEPPVELGTSESTVHLWTPYNNDCGEGPPPFEQFPHLNNEAVMPLQMPLRWWKRSKLLNRMMQIWTRASGKSLKTQLWNLAYITYLNKLSEWECKVSIDLRSSRPREQREMTWERRSVGWTCSFLCTKHCFVSHWNSQQSWKPEAPMYFMDFLVLEIGIIKRNFWVPNVSSYNYNSPAPEQDICKTWCHMSCSLMLLVTSFNRTSGLPCDCLRPNLSALTSVVTPTPHPWPLMGSLSQPGFS